MPITRNARAKNIRTHRRMPNREANKKIVELSHICDKHNIGKLTFRSCKYADPNGLVTFVEYDEIRGNMKAGILLVKAIETVQAINVTYDLVKLATDKKERAEKKLEADNQKGLEELTKIYALEEQMKKLEESAKNVDSVDLTVNNQTNSTTDELKELTENVDSVDLTVNNQTNSTTDELKELTENVDSVNITVNNQTNSTTDELKELTENVDSVNLTVNNQTNNMIDELKESIDVELDTAQTDQLVESDNQIINNDSQIINNDSQIINNDSQLVNDTTEVLDVAEHPRKAKRDRAIKQYQEELERKAAQKEGNKYFRNFMKDLRAKFPLVNLEIRYFEAKVEMTEMVIDGPRAYQLKMPDSVKETYYLIIGDFVMKSGLARQIDPAYRSESVFKEQQEFLDRIKAKESSNTKEYNAELIDDEEDFEDIDALGLETEETNDNDNNDNDNDDDDDEMPALEPISLTNSLN